MGLKYCCIPKLQIKLARYSIKPESIRGFHHPPVQSNVTFTEYMVHGDGAIKSKISEIHPEFHMSNTPLYRILSVPNATHQCHVALTYHQRKYLKRAVRKAKKRYQDSSSSSSSS